MELQPVVPHLAKLICGNADLGVDLVNDSACAAGALVIHGRDLFLASGFRVLLEDDDLGVLAAQLDDRAALGVKVLDRKRDSVYLLDEFCPDVRRDGTSA